MDYKVVKSEKVFEGRILKVMRDKITMPDGDTAI